MVAESAVAFAVVERSGAMADRIVVEGAGWVPGGKLAYGGGGGVAMVDMLLALVMAERSLAMAGRTVVERA